MPKYPEIRVELSGTDGNAYAILGKVSKAIRRAGVDAATRKEFTTEATSGDYDELLATAMRWVDVS